MQDRRKSPRALNLKTGKIVSERVPEPMATAVLDLSEQGACLLVSDIAEVPDTFDLILDPDGTKLSCEVRWKTGYRLGVHFSEPCGLTFYTDLFRE